MVEKAIMTHACLRLNDLEFKLHLGVTELEQKELQPIRVSIEVEYQALPKGCFNDAIEDADCYATLAQRAELVAHRKIYRLLEHLAFSIHEELKTILSHDTCLSIKVDKCLPPIASSKGPASFTLKG